MSRGIDPFLLAAPRDILTSISHSPHPTRHNRKRYALSGGYPVKSHRQTERTGIVPCCALSCNEGFWMQQHESDVGGDKIDTSGGASVGGNVDAGKDFTGRDKANVNVNVYPTIPPRRRRPAGDRASGITMAEANALWESINRLSEAVGGLKSSVDANSRETGKLAGAVDDQSEKFQVIDKAILTIQTGLAELGLTPTSQREPKWKTNVLVGSTAVIAVCVLLGLAYLMFGGA